eukprot:6584448-Heterocapsa_arctica.AAC.1
MPEKGKGKGKIKGKIPEFQGYCKPCGRWGHKRLDCYATVHMLAEEIQVPDDEEEEPVPEEENEDQGQGETYDYEDEVGV